MNIHLMGEVAYLLVSYITQYGRMGIVDLATCVQKFWFFSLICFFLGLMVGYQSNVSAPMLSSDSLHRTVGETVPTLYPRAFIYFRISMIGTFLHCALLS